MRQEGWLCGVCDVEYSQVSPNVSNVGIVALHIYIVSPTRSVVATYNSWTSRVCNVDDLQTRIAVSHVCKIALNVQIHRTIGGANPARPCQMSRVGCVDYRKSCVAIGNVYVVTSYFQPLGLAGCIVCPERDRAAWIRNI